MPGPPPARGAVLAPNPFTDAGTERTVLVKPNVEEFQSALAYLKTRPPLLFKRVFLWQE